jgi:hypothetical protein
MHKSAMKSNETLSKWCKNKHEASKIMDTFEKYQAAGASAAAPVQAPVAASDVATGASAAAPV